jgi:hypothetical protein
MNSNFLISTVKFFSLFLLFQLTNTCSATIPNIIWKSYFGGTSYDGLFDMTTDKSGNLYIIGSSKSSGLATPGAYQGVCNGGVDFGDVIISKFNPNGVRVWCTYFGGSSDEGGSKILIDSNNNLIITGTTASTSNIASVGAFQSTFGGSFIAKFDTSGNRIWSTYFGGASTSVDDLALDPAGNIILGGGTGTSSFFTGPHQAVFGGSSDGFLAKFSNTGQKIWATYYGGLDGDRIRGVSAGLSGNLYVIGTTSSSLNIATSGSHSNSFNGVQDAFVVKFDGQGNRLWGTYYGGSDYDVSIDMIVNSNDEVIISGSTASVNGITTAGAYQQNLASVGNVDLFIAKLNSSGNRIWGTYYGSIGYEDVGGDLKIVNNSDDFFISGMTGGPITFGSPNCYQGTCDPNSYDGFFSRFDTYGYRIWSTYYGKSGFEGTNAICFFNNKIGIVGTTSSLSGLSSPNSHQPAYGGGDFDGYIAYFDENMPSFIGEIYETKYKLNVSPNPTSGILYLNDIQDELLNSPCQIFDLIGRRMNFYSEINSISQKIKIDISKFEQGVYILYFNGQASIIQKM